MIKLLRKLPYPIFMRLYFYYYNKKKDIFFKDITESDSNFKALKKEDLMSKKTSNTLFIIGSGYSLNNITKQQWEEINFHDTLGFNFSFLNKDHTPTYYTCEAMAPMEINDEGRSYFGDLFYTLFKDAKKRYKGVLKFATDLEPSRLNHFNNYGKDIIEDNFFLANTVNGIAGSKEDFIKLIKYYKKKGFFDSSKNLENIFKFKATLVAAISFGPQLGYKNIVLCGIDLNDTRYFYQEKKIYPHLPYFQSSPKKPVHDTLTSSDLFISVDTVIDVMNEEILKPKGVKLSIQNPDSALKDILPTHIFNV